MKEAPERVPNRNGLRYSAPNKLKARGRCRHGVFRVSAQPAPSGFEADSVVCSSKNRNNGRTAWDAKDEIIGRSNCPNIGTVA